jgi:hypothetical protein
VFSDLRTSYGWHDFLDGRTPSDPMRRIEKWRDRTGHLIPARDREAWDRIWSSNLGEAPRSHARDDVAVQRRAEWQWRMHRALDLIRRLLNETGPARQYTDPDQVRDQIWERWQKEDDPQPAPPKTRWTTEELAVDEGVALTQALRSLVCAPDEEEPGPDDDTHHGRVVRDARAWIKRVDAMDNHMHKSTAEAKRRLSPGQYGLREPVQEPEWRRLLIKDVEERVEWLRYRLATSDGEAAEPTEQEIKERAELFLAQFHDAVGANSSPYFGPHQARIMARDQLRRELGGEPGTGEEVSN